jgi:hypothetical protein
VPLIPLAGLLTTLILEVLWKPGRQSRTRSVDDPAFRARQTSMGRLGGAGLVAGSTPKARTGIDIVRPKS